MFNKLTVRKVKLKDNKDQQHRQRSTKLAMVKKIRLKKCSMYKKQWIIYRVLDKQMDTTMMLRIDVGLDQCC